MVVNTSEDDISFNIHTSCSSKTLMQDSDTPLTPLSYTSETQILLLRTFRNSCILENSKSYTYERLMFTPRISLVHLSIYLTLGSLRQVIENVKWELHSFRSCSATGFSITPDNNILITPSFDSREHRITTTKVSPKLEGQKIRSCRGVRNQHFIFS